MKLTKEHVGKKIWHPVWRKESYAIVTAVGKTRALIEHHWSMYCEAPYEAEADINDNWELYQEPVWWEENREYKVKGGVRLYRFYLKDDVWFCTRTGDEANFVADPEKLKKENFEEYTPPKKKKIVRMAPALYRRTSDCRIMVGDFLFISEAKAKEYCGDHFIKWPANENMWCEVEVEE